MTLAPSYAALVLVQAALVLAPARLRRRSSSRLLGLAVPAAAMAVGIAVARAAGGADLLTAFAAVATPVLAACAGWARGWPLPWLAVPAVVGLYAAAWLEPGTLGGQAAGLLLIAGACLAATGFVAALAPPSWLAAGLVLLVALDVALVWGDRQVQPTMTALHAAAAPAIAGGRRLPSLQEIDFGDATMGWLDFAAPALLGAIAARRAAAAVATGVAGLAWGLLLAVTSPIPATVPVLAGLTAGRRRPRSRRASAGRAGRRRSAC